MSVLQWWGEFLSDEYLSSKNRLIFERVASMAFAGMFVLGAVGQLLAHVGLGVLPAFLAYGILSTAAILGIFAMMLGLVSWVLTARYILAITMLLLLLKLWFLRRCRKIDVADILRNDDLVIERRVHVFSKPVAFVRSEFVTGRWVPASDALLAGR
jgi:hypothetical protein